ncbi:Cytochrome P450 protein [Rutstroemia sp. NJR-2017a BBW]|nr:Cytochrome P450 protein [Rutstroemia sp. NJR-2017a BBW]
MEQDSKFGFFASLIARLSTTHVLLAIVLGPFTIAIFRYTRPSDLPVVNAYPYDFFHQKAHTAYFSNAKGLIEEGRKKHTDCVSFINMIQNPDYTASHVRGLGTKLSRPGPSACGSSCYPGFEANRTITDPRKIVINVVRKKFNQNRHWHTVNLSEDLIRFVGRMSEAVFVGPDLSTNPEWQDLVISHTLRLFAAVKALRGWPAFIRPVVHWFLPEFRACRQQVRQAKSMLRPILDSRAQMKSTEEPPKFDDTIEWIEEEAAERPIDPAEVQLGFAIAALHTTTELLKQALLDICAHPELVQQIRQEVLEAVRESGWTTAGLFKMQLLDSAIKETQRMHPGSIVGLEREVVRDVTLPNGVKLPRGTKIGVDSSVMWDSNVYPDPREYDPQRYLRLRQSGNSAAVLSSSSPDHHVFGLGKSVCPGRFFASNEVKIAIARIILNYDLRAKVKSESRRVVEVGFMMFSMPGVPLEIEIKRRQEEL